MLRSALLRGPRLWRQAVPRSLASARYYTQTTTVGFPVLAEFRMLGSTSPALLDLNGRGFASNSKSDQEVEIPLDIPGITGKYATVLYSVAAKENILDQVDAELKEVAAAAVEHSLFAEFIRDASLSKDMKSRAIKDIFGDTKYSELTKNFLVIVTENGRLKQLQKICDNFGDLMFARRGLVKVTITTALKASQQEIEKIKSSTVKEHLKAGQSPLVTAKVNEGLLGGYVLEIGDKLVDYSIASRIKQMEKVLIASLAEPTAAAAK